MSEVDEAVIDPGQLFTPEAARDPHAVYRTLRERCPVARADFAGMPSIFLSRYEDVLYAMRHPEIFSSSADALSIGQEQPLIPLQVDPPLHTDYRRLLNPSFVPRAIAGMEPDARALTNELIDAFASRGSCDFHEELATPLPSTIFLRLLRLPQSDLAQFLQWRDNVIRPDVPPGDFEAAARLREQTGHEISEYFSTAIDDRRARPDDGLLSQLVHARIDGRELRRDELLGMCQLLMLGGLDTVTATLDCMVLWLAAHPEQRQLLIDDPGRIPGAVEELLRHQTPVMVVPRIMKQDAELAGVALHAGDPVTLVLGAANADDGEFGHGDDVDLTRDPNRHLAFGGGNHLCLGAHLARLELRVAMEELHRRIPDYQVPADARITLSPGIRQADSLPLVFTPAE